MSSRWLKSENVSQSSLRRLQEEKAARQSSPPDERPPVNSPPDNHPVDESSPAQSSGGQTPAPPPESHPLTIVTPLPPNAPHLRLPYVTLDRLRKLKAGPRAVCEEIYRAAAGWHTNECVISIAKLAIYCQTDEKYVRKYVTQLVELGYIERLGEITGGREYDSRGVHFRVLLPRMAPPDKRPPGQKSGGDNRPPIKENAFKGNIKEPVVCDLCKNSSGMYYPSGTVGVGPVKRCDHQTGK